MKQQKEKTEEHERWERDCLAKATFCAWSASLTPDKDYRDFLSALAVEWKELPKLNRASRQSTEVRMPRWLNPVRWRTTVTSLGPPLPRDDMALSGVYLRGPEL
jgi:hypothetical protein